MSRTPSGSSFSAREVNPTRSTNRIETMRRSSPARAPSPSTAPHELQNFEPSGFSPLQRVQTDMDRAYAGRGPADWRRAGSALAHEALAGCGDERDGLGEENAHGVTQREGLLVDAAGRLNLLERRRRQLDRGVQRERRKLLALRLLHRLGLLLGELAQTLEEILGIPAEERKAALAHAENVPANCRRAGGGTRLRSPRRPSRRRSGRTAARPRRATPPRDRAPARAAARRRRSRPAGPVSPGSAARPAHAADRKSVV